MLEYHALRAVLGLAQLVLVWGIRRRDIGYLWWFGCLMYANGIFNLLPALPRATEWKHWIQIPMSIGTLALTIAATVEIFAFMRRRTFPQERSLLLCWAIVLAAIPVSAGWIWDAENWYQAVMIGRQYTLIGLACGFAGAWTWITWIRPIRIEHPIEHHGDMWFLWLVCSALLSTTTKGGIFWRLFPWDGGESIWRLSSDGLLIAQVWCAVGFALNLYHWRSGSPDATPIAISDPPVLGPSRPLHQ